MIYPLLLFHIGVFKIIFLVIGLPFELYNNTFWILQIAEMDHSLANDIDPE